jgi:hypothetical protein
MIIKSITMTCASIIILLFKITPQLFLPFYRVYKVSDLALIGTTCSPPQIFPKKQKKKKKKGQTHPSRELSSYERII